MKKIISFAAIAVSLVAVSSLLVTGGYLVFEPEMTIAQVSSTSSITVTLTVDEEITLSPPPSNIIMSPNIGVSASSSIGTGNAWNVVTNASSGYALTFHATATPALIDGAKSFIDATTTSPVTWGFGVGQSCSTTTCFGFSVHGDDVPTGTWGNSTDCGSGGTPNASLNYRGFNGTTPITVASSALKTGVSGTDTVLCVAAAQNTEFAPSGTYTATIVGTATTQ